MHTYLWEFWRIESNTESLRIVFSNWRSNQTLNWREISEVVSNDDDCDNDKAMLTLHSSKQKIISKKYRCQNCQRKLYCAYYANLRLFFNELQEVKLGGQQRSNRGQSTHTWKKTARDSIVGENTHSNVLCIYIYVNLTSGVIQGHKRSNSEFNNI